MSETRQAVYAGTKGALSYRTVKQEQPIPNCVRKEIAEFALAMTKKYTENIRNERSNNEIRKNTAGACD